MNLQALQDVMYGFNPTTFSTSYLKEQQHEDRHYVLSSSCTLFFVFIPAKYFTAKLQGPQLSGKLCVICSNSSIS